MGAALSLIPELEEVIQHGTQQKRADTLERITTLFLSGADQYADEQVNLFDDVFGLLIKEIETKARVELANRIAPVSNAPAGVLRTLASDDDIAVAGPVLKHAPRLADADLIDVARTKSQAHLHAISTRQTLTEPVTDVLVRRGGREVVRSVADNRGAKISEHSFFNLIKRAEDDGVLAEKVGTRPDIPAPMFRELLLKATAVVRERLLATAPSEARKEINRILAKVSREVAAKRRPARLSRGATCRARFSSAPALSTKRRWRLSAATANTKRRRWGWRSSPKCRSMSSIVCWRQSARSGADPLQGGRIRLADGEGDHRAARRR